MESTIAASTIFWIGVSIVVVIAIVIGCIIVAYKAIKEYKKIKIREI